jgi:DNA-binding CsgD family transcriptional regulator
MLTTFELDEYVFEAIRSGASGFLVKDTEPDELLRAVRAVVAGDALLSPGVTRRLIAEFAARSKEPAAADALGRLTEREREVMALVGMGLSNEEIARRLVVSPLTAKTHVSRTTVKPGARDRAQLVVLAYARNRTSTLTTRAANRTGASTSPVCGSRLFGCPGRLFGCPGGSRPARPVCDVPPVTGHSGSETAGRPVGKRAGLSRTYAV